MEESGGTDDSCAVDLAIWFDVFAKSSVLRNKRIRNDAEWEGALTGLTGSTG